jgi:mRNA deadenylase 3'-5' endonuclease subunit Ccr4
LNSKIQAGILIQQIGDLNKVIANLKSNEVKVAINQNGDRNLLLLDKDAKSITQNIVQQGDNNKISDFTLYTNYNVNMEMVQKGDNQNIQNIGTNSLSKNMKITQTGNGASIILINK